MLQRHALTFGIADAVQIRVCYLCHVECLPHQRNNVLSMVARCFGRQEAVSGQSDVCLADVGQNTSVSNNPNTNFIGTSLESQRKHPTSPGNMLALPHATAPKQHAFDPYTDNGGYPAVRPHMQNILGHCGP